MNDQAENQSDSFRSKIGAILFLTGIFFLNFISRVCMGPLLPAMEKDMGFSHTEAGFLFLMLSIGYFITMTTSGFISSKLNHDRIISISAFGVGAALLLISQGRSLASLQIALFILGLGAGLYLPSAVPTITSLVKPQNWGKAVAIHEMAPNLGLILSPVLAEIALYRASWQTLMIILGVLSLAVGPVYLIYGRGGDFKGQAPRPGVIASIVKERNFWIMMILFGLGVGGSLGIYHMLSLYMVNDAGLTRNTANSILAASRIIGLFIAFVSGWASDRFGVKPAIRTILILSGVATILLGAFSGLGLIIMVFFQAALSASFFPAGFAAISSVGRPEERNLVVALTIPMAFLLGSGALPYFIGFMGETFTFHLGISISGVIILMGAGLVSLLRFQPTQ